MKIAMNMWYVVSNKEKQRITYTSLQIRLYSSLYTQCRAWVASGPTSNIPGIDATIPCRLIATTGARIILSSDIVIDNAAQTFLAFVSPRCTTF